MLRYTLSYLMFFSLASAHGVILAAQGEANSPPSVGFRVDPAIARNCTTISPCQQDTTLIRDAEIAANIVNKCGRTELKGNIDIGEETENALTAGAVTKVKAGLSNYKICTQFLRAGISNCYNCYCRTRTQLISKPGTIMTVTIHQVNADGAGPYTCDIDQTGNSGLISQNLAVTNNVPGANGFSQAKTQQFNISVALPDNLSCTGASTGNVCTIRCRNTALAGPFGGCFPVQQTDTKPVVNSANQIQTFASLDAVNRLIEANNRDFAAAVAANQVAGSDEGAQGRAAVDAILSNTIVSSAAPVQTPSLDNVGTNAPVASGVGDSTASTLVTSATRTASGGATSRKTSTIATATNRAGSGTGNVNNGGSRNRDQRNGEDGNANQNGEDANRNGEEATNDGRRGTNGGDAQNNKRLRARDREAREEMSILRWAKRR